MLTIDQIAQVVKNIGKKYQIKNAYLFGSYARGEATENSDVDILIDRGAIRNFSTLSRFRLELSDNLGTDIDLLTTNGIRDDFFQLIKNDRVLLYES